MKFKTKQQYQQYIDSLTDYEGQQMKPYILPYETLVEAGKEFQKVRQIEDENERVDKWRSLVIKYSSIETEAEKAERVKREIEEDMMCQRYHDVLELILDGDLKVFTKLLAKKNINH